jgi:hypothetical protein
MKIAEDVKADALDDGSMALYESGEGSFGRLIRGAKEAVQ